jgi:erythromycin esterase
MAAGTSAAVADTAGTGGTGEAEVVTALDSVAKPLTRDLDAFGAMVGDAQVVGVGEVTHSTAEFYALGNGRGSTAPARRSPGRCQGWNPLA